MNAALIRQMNLAKVFHAIREHPGSSQRDLNQITHLDKATMSAVVNQLEHQGLVLKTLKDASGRKGRPEKALYINQAAGVLLGASLDVNEVRLLVMHFDGEVISQRSVKSTKNMPEVLALLNTLMDDVLADAGLNLSHVRGLGIGLAELVDVGGKLAYSLQSTWQAQDIRQELQLLFPFPIYLDNEMNAAVLAEKLFGVSKDAQNYLYFAEHSRLGAGLFINDTVYRGKDGFAGELGHTIVVPNGRLCSCGNKGCLKAYISQDAILEQFGRTYVSLDEAFKSKSKKVQAVLEEASLMLATALLNVIYTVNPELIVLGGKLSLFAQHEHLSPQKYLKKMLLPPLQKTKVLGSALATESVLIGGAGLALEGFLALPNLQMQQLLKSSEQVKKVTTASELYLRNYHKKANA